jgi:putative acetyltransferase
LKTPDGELLGTIGLFPMDAETVELRKMYFAPHFRGKGHGQKMVARAISNARKMGFKKIYLETASVLEVAVHIYKKFGFKPFGDKHTPRCDQGYVLMLADGDDESVKS